MNMIILGCVAAAAWYLARRWNLLRAENTDLKAQLSLLKRRLVRKG